MNEIFGLIDRLYYCPPGKSGWKEFEDVCIEILCFLFIPPLTVPKIQTRTQSGIDVRDAIFPNRNFDSSNPWGYIFQELSARLILFEFKNYEKEEIAKEEVNQIRNYLKTTMGRLAILCCSKKPNKSAYICRNSVYNEEKKIILFLTKDHLKEMIFIKERGEDPTDLILDMIEEFYLQHE